MPFGQFVLYVFAICASANVTADRILRCSHGIRAALIYHFLSLHSHAFGNVRAYCDAAQIVYHMLSIRDFVGPNGWPCIDLVEMSSYSASYIRCIVSFLHWCVSFVNAYATMTCEQILCHLYRIGRISRQFTNGNKINFSKSEFRMTRIHMNSHM